MDSSTVAVPIASDIGFSKGDHCLAEFEQRGEMLEKEQQLNEPEEQFQLLVEAVQDYAIFMLDPTGHILTWNLGAQRIKHYAASEIIGKHFSIFYAEEDKRNGKPQWELELAQSGGRFEDEGWRIRKDGSRFWANVVITALRDKTGELVGFGKVRDLVFVHAITGLECATGPAGGAAVGMADSYPVGIKTVFYLESLRENGLASRTADKSGDSVSQSHSSTKRKRRPKNTKRKDPTQTTMAALRQLSAKEKDKKAGS